MPSLFGLKYEPRNMQTGMGEVLASVRSVSVNLSASAIGIVESAVLPYLDFISCPSRSFKTIIMSECRHEKRSLLSAHFTAKKRDSPLFANFASKYGTKVRRGDLTQIKGSRRVRTP